MKPTAVYAGSFDPPTNGHFDVIRRAAEIFSKVVVVVAVNPAKDSMFTLDERVEMLVQWLVQHDDMDHVTVMTTRGYVYEECADDCVLVRGLRDFADLSEEQAIALFNREHGVETVWLPAVLSSVSSRSLKEHVEMGSPKATVYAPDWVVERVRAKLEGK